MNSPREPEIGFASIFIWIMSISVLTVLGSGCGKPTPVVAPDIILITADALRADHMGCYGYSRPTTPTLDRFARYASHCQTVTSASSWTLPSLMTLHTGLSPVDHGINRPVTHEQEVSQRVRRLSWNQPTLAELFSQAGYNCLGFASGGYAGGWFGFNRGFHHFSDFFQHTDNFRELTARGIDPARDDWILQQKAALSAENKGEDLRKFLEAGIFNRHIIEEIQEADAGPLFLWIHYFEPHSPYLPIPPFSGIFHSFDGENAMDQAALGWAARPESIKIPPESRSPEFRQRVIDLYDSEIRSMDTLINEVLVALMQRRNSRETLVVFTADHGEEFFERGGSGHGHAVTPELSEIPIIFGNLRVGPGRVITEYTQTADVPVTLAVAGKVNIPDTWHGRDLLRTYPLKSESRTLFCESNCTSWVGVRQDRFFAMAETDPGDAMDVQLFDTNSDPGLRRDISTSHPGETEAMKTHLFIRAGMQFEETAADEIDPGTLEQLKAMGYL